MIDSTDVASKDHSNEPAGKRTPDPSSNLTETGTVPTALHEDGEGCKIVSESTSEIEGIEKDSAEEKLVDDSHQANEGPRFQDSAGKGDIIEEEAEEEIGDSYDAGVSMEHSDNRQHQHMELIKKLRLQLRDLEKYAYERGELSDKELPPSLLAERQKIIIESLNRKLPINLDKEKIEKLELDELKEQVDKEIDDLINPLITREHLLAQLKTQLTDLELYISHLHKTLGRQLSESRKGATTGDSEGECICPKHGPQASGDPSMPDLTPELNRIINNNALPRTSRLIRGLLAQLVCSDPKIQDSIKKVDSRRSSSGLISSGTSLPCESSSLKETVSQVDSCQKPITKVPQFHDGATWTLHLDKVILATDSLINLYSLDQNNNLIKSDTDKNFNAPYKANNLDKQQSMITPTSSGSSSVDDSLVESIVRRQLIPAIRDLLTYGLINPSAIPKTNSYASFIFDPYYLLSSLTCFPGLTSSTNASASSSSSSSNAQFTAHTDEGKIHLWNIIEDYYQTRCDVNNFRNSSVKTLSQSFQLTPSMNGPIKITSKQALLIAIDDVIQKMAKSRPNGPDSHFKMLVYLSLNQCKLATWLRIIFKNKSVLRKYYHNFSFVTQPEKVDRFLSILEPLSSIQFNLPTDVEQSIADQFLGIAG